MKIFRKISVLILIALLLISSIVATTGCTASESEEEILDTSASEDTKITQSEVLEETDVTESRESDNTQTTEYEVLDNSESQSVENPGSDELTDEFAKSIITNIIEAQKQSLLDNNMGSYLNTLNPNDPMIKSDNHIWFYLISKGDLKDFSLELVEILSKEIGRIIASIHLEYTVDKNHYDLTYPLKFEMINNRWVCSGPDYRELTSDNIRLLYFEKDDKYAKLVMEEANKSYETVLDNFNLEDSVDIIIKYYDNYDWLRQFAYPTYKRTFTAWAAGGGNISLTHNQKAKSDEEIKASLRGTLLHEFTHEISYEMTNHGSFPRWLFEGLGEYYGGPPLYATDYGELRLWTIEELDSDKFMELTDKKEVRSYYDSSAKIVGYLLDNYGKDKLIELLNSIAESSLSNDKWMERFIEVFEATYGITYDEFKEDWRRFIESQ